MSEAESGDGVEYGLQLDDWSQTGRGSHVDFQTDETVPLNQGELRPFSPSGLLNLKL